MSKFFDAHLHLTLKNQFSENGNSSSPWKEITREDLKDGMRDIDRFLKHGLVEKMFASQSSVDMLFEGGYQLVVMPLFAPDIELVRAIKKKKAFYNIIAKNQQGKFKMLVNLCRYDDLAGETNPVSIALNDLNLLTLTHPEHPGKKVVYLQKSSDWDPAAADTLFVVGSVEGVHTLRSDLLEINTDLILEDIKTNLKTVQTKGLKLLMINLAHIDGSNKVFANQAYAMDGMRSIGFKEEDLRPQGCGLTDAGKKLVDFLEGDKICSDVKHMSPLARFDLYKYRRQKGITSPIVSSHSGLCGISFKSDDEEYSDYVFKKQKTGNSFEFRVGKPSKYSFPGFDSVQVGFNASSINLFDEDVKEIYESDGLLGISLDERVLGFTMVSKTSKGKYSKNVEEWSGTFGGYTPMMTDTDFISVEECEKLGLDKEPRKKFLNRCVNAEDLHQFLTDPHDLKKELQFCHFINHILHCVRLGIQFEGEKGVEKMLTQVVCIGSDYDGLIEPIDITVTCRQIRDLKARFIRDFESAINRNHLFLPQNWTVSQLADRIFFENGRDFVLRRLDAM